MSKKLIVVQDSRNVMPKVYAYEKKKPHINHIAKALAMKYLSEDGDYVSLIFDCVSKNEFLAKVIYKDYSVKITVSKVRKSEKMEIPVECLDEECILSFINSDVKGIKGDINIEIPDDEEEIEDEECEEVEDEEEEEYTMRILINNGDLMDENYQEIQEALDEAFIRYDWDGGDRLMISSTDYEDVDKTLTKLGYDLDII